MKSIRYTHGPEEVELGDITFKRGVFQPISDELAAQALLPERITEFGFEEEVPVQTSAPRGAAKATAPAADPTLTATKE